MADFRYKKHSAGMTVGMLELPANGAVEQGDLIDSTLAKADASDADIKFIAMEDADDGADVLLMPVLNGTVLEGTVDSGGGVSAGDSVGIAVATDTQEIDENAANSLFIAMEDGSDGDSINVLVIAGM